jgi:ABC-type glycerol-3-phosphate transport system substrate-binding protein
LGEVGGTITVSCYEAVIYKSFLDLAAQKFEEMYPDTKVVIETVGSLPEVRMQESDNMRMAVVQNPENPQAKEDYITKINTELMSGRGADVIAMDVLPYYKYADNGQLQDLNNYLKTDTSFNMSDYAANLITGTKYKDGQYIFPVSYTFDYFAYDSSLDPSFPTKDKLTFPQVIEAVADKAQVSGHKIFGMSGFSTQMRDADLFSALFALDYDQYVDAANKKVNLTDGRFTQLLESIQAYEDAGYVDQAVFSDGRSDMTSRLSTFQLSRQERYYAKKNTSFALMGQYTRNLGQRMSLMMAGGGSGDTSDDEVAGLVANEKGEAPFSSAMAFGINSNSKNKGTAWEFVKFLASEEMQSSGAAMPNAIPVNNNARATLAAMTITGEAMLMQANRFGPGTAIRPEGPDAEAALIELTPELTPAQQTALDNYLQTMNKFTAQLNKFMIRDDKIDTMVRQEVSNFFTGEKTAEEVAAGIQSKVSLYLNE